MLENLSKEFELVIFTASHSSYAQAVIDLLDPENKFLSARLSRESCVKTKDGIHVKDLRIFKNRDLEDLLIVDNSLYCFGFQLDRGIPIYPFYQDPLDTELYDLEDFLLDIKSTWKNGGNTSTLIMDHFMFSEYVNYHENQLELIM
jgi:CTD small phosphatase-like protein 2